MTKLYAYSLEGKPPEKWQLIVDHLASVARIAAEFALPFIGDGPELPGCGTIWENIPMRFRKNLMITVRADHDILC